MAEIPGIQLNRYTPDNKILVQQTSRPDNTTIYFTSEGDSTSNPTALGGGNLMQIIHDTGDATTQYIYMDFNVKENRTYVHEGYIMWQDAMFDVICMEATPQVTHYTDGTSTNFNLYAGYLIVPAAGDGVIQVAEEEIRLVEMPKTFDTQVRPAAFWNADYDTVTHTFSNITPAPYGDGVYNIFGIEVPLSRFVNRVLLLNNGFMKLESSDITEIGHNMRIKLQMTTRGEDHAWKAACILSLHREIVA